MDKISIKELKVFAYHGCDVVENKDGQDFFISADILLNFDKVCISDNLDHTVDYSKVCYVIKDAFCKEKYKTLEKCASVVIDSIFAYSSLIEEVNLKIDKPNTPIDLEFDTISIEMSKKYSTVFLGLGSNLGDKVQNLDSAIAQIKKIAKVQSVAKYTNTKPWGEKNQPDYVNTVAKISTTLSPTQLLEELNKIENNLGRVRTIKWAARTIDIDILLYDNLVINKDNLVIPHPYLHSRKFVLQTLAEIAPHFVHPILNQSILSLSKQITE